MGRRICIPVTAAATAALLLLATGWTSPQPGPRQSSSDQFRAVFDENCGETVYDELLQVPFDNALKYSLLAVVAYFPTFTAPARTVATEELMGDVTFATLRGLGRCFRSEENRRIAARSAALAKATNDWKGFLEDMTKLSGMTPQELVAAFATTDDTIGDLAESVDAGGEFFKFITDRTFQNEIEAIRWVAAEQAGSCQFATAEYLFTESRARARARRPEAVREMIDTSRRLTGNPITTESELLAFDPAPYVNTNAGDVTRFVGARGDYVVINRLLAEPEGLPEDLQQFRTQYGRAKGLIEQHFSEGRLAFEQCDQPRMKASLQLIRGEADALAESGGMGNRYTLRAAERILMGIDVLSYVIAGGTDPASASTDLHSQGTANDGCWGSVVREYNELAADYVALSDINVPGRDSQEFLHQIDLGQRALPSCNIELANTAYSRARGLLPVNLDPRNLCFSDGLYPEARLDSFAAALESRAEECGVLPTVPGENESGEELLACGAIIGSWKWPAGTVTFSGGGFGGTASAVGNPNINSGVWECVDGDTIEVTWDDGRYVDTITVNGDTLVATNQNGYRFTSDRWIQASDPPAGETCEWIPGTTVFAGGCRCTKANGEVYMAEHARCGR